MAVTRAYLKEIVLTGRAFSTTIKVVRHVAGPLTDGSIIREVADNSVYMKAVFTKEAQDYFQLSSEDSFNSQVHDWSQGLLILQDYSVEFQPFWHPMNVDKKARFILVVNRFALWDNNQGFSSKYQLKDVMADPEVQAKARSLENEFSIAAAAELANADYTSHNEAVSYSCQTQDVSLSLLLDNLASDSIPLDTMHSQEADLQHSGGQAEVQVGEPAGQQNETVEPSNGDSQPVKASHSVAAESEQGITDLLLEQMGQSSQHQVCNTQQGTENCIIPDTDLNLELAAKEMKRLTVEDFIISAHQQLVLDKMDVLNRGNKNPEEESQQKSQTASASDGSVQFLFDKATLHGERQAYTHDSVLAALTDSLSHIIRKVSDIVKKSKQAVISTPTEVNQKPAVGGSCRPESCPMPQSAAALLQPTSLLASQLAEDVPVIHHIQASASLTPHIQASASLTPHIQASASLTPHIQASSSLTPSAHVSASLTPHIQASSSLTPSAHVSAPVLTPHIQASASLTPSAHVSAPCLTPHIQASASLTPSAHVSAPTLTPHIQASSSLTPSAHVSAPVLTPHIQASSSLTPSAHVSAPVLTPHIEASSKACPLGTPGGDLVSMVVNNSSAKTCDKVSSDDDGNWDSSLQHPDVSFTCSSLSEDDEDCQLFSSDSYGSDKIYLHRLANGSRVYPIEIACPGSKKDLTSESQNLVQVAVATQQLGFQSQGFVAGLVEHFPECIPSDESVFHKVEKNGKPESNTLCLESQGFTVEAQTQELVPSSKLLYDDSFEEIWKDSSAVRSDDRKISQIEPATSDHTPSKRAQDSEEIIFHSTQEPSISSNPPSHLPVNLSPIRSEDQTPGTNFETPVAEEEESLRMVDLIGNQPVSSEQNISVQSTPPPKEDFGSTKDLSAADVSSRGGVVLVEYSGSDSMDSFDEWLLSKAKTLCPQKEKKQSHATQDGVASAQGSCSSSSETLPGTSETTVVPDSSQEEVVVLSSSGETISRTASNGFSDMQAVATSSTIGIDVLLEKNASRLPSPDSSTSGSQLAYAATSTQTDCAAGTRETHKEQSKINTGPGVSKKRKRVSASPPSRTKCVKTVEAVVLYDICKSQEAFSAVGQNSPTETSYREGAGMESCVRTALVEKSVKKKTLLRKPSCLSDQPFLLEPGLTGEPLNTDTENNNIHRFSIRCVNLAADNSAADILQTAPISLGAQRNKNDYVPTLHNAASVVKKKSFRKVTSDAKAGDAVGRSLSFSSPKRIRGQPVVTSDTNSAHHKASTSLRTSPEPTADSACSLRRYKRIRSPLREPVHKHGQSEPTKLGRARSHGEQMQYHLDRFLELRRRLFPWPTIADHLQIINKALYKE